MIWKVRDILISCLRMYMLNDLEKNIFPYRIKDFYGRLFTYGMAILLMLGANHMGSSLINMLLIPVSYMAASVVVFDGSLWKKIIMACCYYMLAIIPEFIFAAVTNSYGAVESEAGFQTELEKTLAILLMRTMTFLFVKCINRITRKRNYSKIENRFFSALLLLPLATIIILACMFYAPVPFTGVNRVMIPIGTIFLLLTNIFVFGVFDKLLEKSEEVRKMERIYQKSMVENRNIQFNRKMDEDNRAFLHDVNKFVCAVADLAENDKLKNVKELVEHLGIRIRELQKYTYCEHPLLNSILCERKFIAEQEGIAYRISLGNGLKLDFLEDLDLISIVGNLLDNAIEAAGKTETDKYVDCRIYMGNECHFLVMEFYNSCAVPPIKSKGKFVSTKRSPGSHGIGLHTVEKLVKKYAGIMKVETGEKEFAVKLIFTI